MADADRIAAIRRKIAAREGNPAFAENVRDLRAELARLEAGGLTSGDDR